jgi:hypothetical protein
MEGTSGAAERVSLRGAAREAALAPVVVAKAASFPDGLASSSGRPVEHRELQTGPAGRPLTAGVWWASLARLRASRSARWARHGHTQARVCPAGSASPAGIATSFTTAGVRADRVGAKLPWRAIATEGAGKGESPPGPCPVKPRLDRSGATGERAQARASEATRASHSIWHPDEGRPLWLGSCFGRVSVSAGG